MENNYFNEMWEWLKKEKAVQKEFIYEEDKYSLPTGVVAGITLKCNLACPYCFVTQDNVDMSYETAEQTAEWLLSNYKKQGIDARQNKAQFFFFGGEPLIRFDDIIVPLVEKYNDRVSFGITTNGVLLDEDKVDFFKKYDIAPLLSFDGVPEVQNIQRPMYGGGASFDKVLKNIPYLLLRFPETVMRATITKDSIKHMYDSYCLGAELGFKHIGFYPNAFEDWGDEEQKELRLQLDKIAISVYKRLVEPKYDFPPFISFMVEEPDILEAYSRGNLPFNNRLLRCGLGTTGIGVMPNGDLIPCHEKVGNPIYIIGNVRDGINPAKHKQFLEDYFNGVSNCTLARPTSQKIANILLYNTCPSRLEDINYEMKTSLIVFEEEIARVGEKMRQLCYNNINPRMQQYFFKGGQNAQS